MEQELGITTEEQLNEAYENIDMSVFGLFVTKGENHEEGIVNTCSNTAIAL